MPEKAEVLRTGDGILGRRLEWPGAGKDPLETVEAVRVSPQGPCTKSCPATLASSLGPRSLAQTPSLSECEPSAVSLHRAKERKREVVIQFTVLSRI